MTKTRRLHVLQNQVKRLQRILGRLRRTSTTYSWARLAVFIGGLVVSGSAFYFFGPWFLLISLVVWLVPFGILVTFHRQVEGSIVRHELWREIKAAQIARMQLDWERVPTTFGHRPEAEHPFEVDLDLVGRRSLYQLVDTAVSYEGSQRLRAWLTTPIPEPEQVTRRQRLVRELVPMCLFREKLILNASLAAGTRKTWEANQLVGWLERHGPGRSTGPWLLLAGALAVVNAVLFIANQLAGMPPLWQITFALYLGLFLTRSRTIGGVFDEAMALQDALRQLSAVFEQLEGFSYRDTPYLKALCAPFLDAARRPSKHLSRVARIVAAMGVRGNPFAWFLLNAPVPWDFYFAHRLNRCKVEIARQAPAWMEVWFELEALGSLANLAYLNPHYTFPEILTEEDTEPRSVFRARNLGHPLIPDDEKVCNDFTVGELGQVTMVTGSNMAGKSVFLKTVGVNLALAFAGGPVNAGFLQTVPWRLFTSMSISDSVTNGLSYFYAEVKRLKRLLSELDGEASLPLCFFIDEIFRGTNNRERLIGSRAYVRSLVDKRGIGFIATHDLELAKLADQMPAVRNYHFRDHVVDQRMAFDYKLHPGPCPTTNALKIMEMEGLPVGVEADFVKGS
jgi:hypothetical protein